MAYDEQLADRVRHLVGGESGYTEMKMFGGAAFLVHGHIAVGASLLPPKVPGRARERRAGSAPTT
jgi:hypothetical protein